MGCYLLLLHCCMALDVHGRSQHRDQIRHVPARAQDSSSTLRDCSETMGYGTYTDCAFSTSFSILSGNRLTLDKCKFHKLKTECIVLAAYGAELYVTNTVFNECSASDGAAIATDTSMFMYGSIIIEQCEFTYNKADNYGGSIFCFSTGTSDLNITDSVFEGNTAKNGGAVTSVGYINVNILTVTAESCKADIDGGVFMFWAGYFNVQNSTLSKSSAASGCGGGIIVNEFAQVTFDDVVFSECSAECGGGVWTRDAFTVFCTGSLFWSCSATDNGGGLGCEGTSDICLEESTFNRCTAETNGGGMYTGVLDSKATEPEVLNIEMRKMNFVSCECNNLGDGCYFGSLSSFAWESLCFDSCGPNPISVSDNVNIEMPSGDNLKGYTDEYCRDLLDDPDNNVVGESVGGALGAAALMGGGGYYAYRRWKNRRIGNADDEQMQGSAGNHSTTNNAGTIVIHNHYGPESNNHNGA